MMLTAFIWRIFNFNAGELAVCILMSLTKMVEECEHYPGLTSSKHVHTQGSGLK